MRSFWFWHAALPAVAFGLLFVAIELLRWDLRIADVLFYDWGAQRWIGANTWWATDLIHTGGRYLVQGVAAASLLIAICRPSRRRAALYVFLCVVLTTALVGTLKHITNVDCPWDLTHFNGKYAYVPLFADRPDELPHAACFPGSHSASAFALMCGYFLLRNRRARAARWVLSGALLLGTVYSFGQQARGAHFLSHDLASAVIAWYMALLLHYSIRAREGIVPTLER